MAGEEPERLSSQPLRCRVALTSTLTRLGFPGPVEGGRPPFNLPIPDRK